MLRLWCHEKIEHVQIYSAIIPLFCFALIYDGVSSAAITQTFVLFLRLPASISQLFLVIQIHVRSFHVIVFILSQFINRVLYLVTFIRIYQFRSTGLFLYLPWIVVIMDSVCLLITCGVTVFHQHSHHHPSTEKHLQHRTLRPSPDFALFSLSGRSTVKSLTGKGERVSRAVLFSSYSSSPFYSARHYVDEESNEDEENICNSPCEISASSSFSVPASQQSPSQSWLEANRIAVALTAAALWTQRRKGALSDSESFSASAIEK